MANTATTRRRGDARDHRNRRRLWLWLGLLMPQLLLLWPSLFGSKVLLPLDNLTYVLPGLFEGDNPPNRPPHSVTQGDTVYQFEAFRRFATSELHAGRLPLWNPHNYGGVPFLANGQTALFSPFRLIEFSSLNPRVLAWSQLAKSIVAGLGIYFFLRFGLRLRWLASVMAAWSYPFTGFVVVWAGYSLAVGAVWLPWLLWAVDACCRSRAKWMLSVSMLAGTTALTISAGHPGVTAQMLIFSGVYACWRVTPWGRLWRHSTAESAKRALLFCLAGWILGLMIASPQVLPAVEYLRDSARMALRQAGTIERPSLGVFAIPQIVNPWFAGELRPGSNYLFPGNRRESAAAAYAGLLVFFIFVPMAFRCRGSRAEPVFWLGVALLGVSQTVGIPILKQLVELQPIAMFSSNRLTSWSALALTVLGAIGLHSILHRGVPRVRLWALPLVLPALFGCYVAWLLAHPPVGTTPNSQAFPGELPEQIRRWFEVQYLITLGLVALAGGMILVLARPGAGLMLRRKLAVVLVFFCVVEMAWSATANLDQIDRKWYPDRPKLISRLSALEPGRFAATAQVMPNLLLWWNLDDIRGYDAADPLRMTQLLLEAGNAGPRYSEALLSAWLPQNWNILSMLGVRYMILPTPSPSLPPVAQAPGLYVYANPQALPRAFVPQNVRTENDSAKRLKLLQSEAFSGLREAFVEAESQVDFSGIRGTVLIKEDMPSRVVLSAELQSPGLVVLADNFAPGWSATVNGQAAPIYRTNHAVRGVPVPAGTSTIEFRYAPSTFKWGLMLSLTAILACAGLAVGTIRSGIKKF